MKLLKVQVRLSVVCLTVFAHGAGCTAAKDTASSNLGVSGITPVGATLTDDPASEEGESAAPVPVPTSPGSPASSEQGAIGPLPAQTTSPDAGSTSCASASAAGELQQLALAFAFDVSGSMGKGDEPYHDKALKWDPIVAASKAFFDSDDIARVSASLVFFPTEDEDDRCDAESYANPDVPLTQLPSNEFSDAIDAVAPASEEDWRGGTPTLAVIRATIDYVRELRDAGSTARHAIVLVTDGTPQGCDDEDDSVEAVAEAVAAANADIPTYVIGVANPITDDEPNPPDNVSSLNQIAESGGTETAFLVDTGSPTDTIAKFSEIIQSIRSQGLSCEVTIPPPPNGMTFDQDMVNVSLTIDDEAHPLGYSALCSEPEAWHFDDEAAPTRIVLCDDTCALTKSSAEPSLQVEFGCERRTGMVR